MIYSYWYQEHELGKTTTPEKAQDYVRAKLKEQGFENYENIYVDKTTGKIRDTPSLPQGYTQLEYIQSTGQQYIDTEFMPNTDSKVILMFKTQQAINKSCFLFASRASDYSNHFGVFYSSECYVGRFSNVSDYNSNVGFSKDVKTTIELSEDGFIIDDKKIEVSGTLDSLYNLYIFAANTGNNVTSFSKYQLFECKIFDNNTIVRNFIPTKNNQDVVGLYDIVNDVFYENEITGADGFIAGPEV